MKKRILSVLSFVIAALIFSPVIKSSDNELKDRKSFSSGDFAGSSTRALLRRMLVGKYDDSVQSDCVDFSPKTIIVPVATGLTSHESIKPQTDNEEFENQLFPGTSTRDLLRRRMLKGSFRQKEIKDYADTVTNPFDSEISQAFKGELFYLKLGYAITIFDNFNDFLKARSKLASKNDLEDDDDVINADDIPFLMGLYEGFLDGLDTISHEDIEKESEEILRNQTHVLVQDEEEEIEETDSEDEKSGEEDEEEGELQ